MCSPPSVPPDSSADLPLWLAHRHRELAVDDLFVVAPNATARLAADGTAPAWEAIVEGAGFAVAPSGHLTRLHSLPDIVGPDMNLLVVGLNPSPASADTGIGFARPGNRFWPAAIAAGLVERDRDPFHALEQHSVGFTDIAKRTTRKAAELSREEFRHGLGRLDNLCRWLQPEACVMVGLMGWRAAVEPKAGAGWQATELGGRPVYVMPSTSGLNASSSLADLTGHLIAATGKAGGTTSSTSSSS